MEEQLKDISDRIAHVRTLVGECSDLLDSLESHLGSALDAVPKTELEQQAERIMAIASR